MHTFMKYNYFASFSMFLDINLHPCIEIEL